MPELPEVEVVRRGLEQWVAGRTVADVEVRHVRAVRRHVPGAVDFADRLRGATLHAPKRRGKYLWLPMSVAGQSETRECVVVHLGMSGQMLIADRGAPEEKHLRVALRFDDGGPDLRFVDQRTFGGLLLDGLVAVDASASTEAESLPLLLAHIARDPIDPQFDDQAWVKALRAKRTVIKRALLEQSLISGIGNIYADEALWRVKLNGERPTASITAPKARELLAAVRDVLGEALAAGGTSFDSLYVNVNGQSGYFDRSLNAYGREGLACYRCGAAMRRMSFMNRSSFFCPRCQPLPRVS